jgi:hypothetical protein
MKQSDMKTLIPILSGRRADSFEKARPGYEADLPAEAAAAMQKAGVALPASPQALLDPETVAAMESALRGAGEGGQLPAVLETMRASLAGALDSAFLLAAIALGLAFVACLFLREIPLRRSNVPEA